MKKFLPVVVLLALVLIIGGCEKMAKDAAKVEEPCCVGTYSPEITVENQEVADMLKEMGQEWPSITLKEDASFVLKGEQAIEGTYVIADSTITLTYAMVEGAEVTDVAPVVVAISADKKVLTMDGKQWVKKAAEKKLEQAIGKVDDAVEQVGEAVEKVKDVAEKAAEVTE